MMRRFLDDSRADEGFEWDSLTSENDLPHNWIYDLFEDSAGRMWVGTWGGGLARYSDGEWRVFTTRHGLASNAVTSIREDAQHRIWVATDSGLNRLVGDSFVEAGLTGKSILTMCIDRNQHLWTGSWRASRSGGGLTTFDGRSWRTFSIADGLPGLEILKIFEDSRGRIWVGTYENGKGAGVGCWNGSTWTRFSTKDGLIDDCVYSMFEDPEGRMWFGTTGGVSVFDGSTWQRLTTRDGLVHERVYAMFIDRDKKMWFGTEGGVSRFDGTSWQSFTRKDGLVENLTRTIVQDREGTLWFGTYPYSPRKGGISRARRPSSHLSITERAQRLLSARQQPGQLGSG